MTDIEKMALLLFKEHTFLQLKSFSVERNDSINNEEAEVLNKALEFFRIYNKLKLKNKNDKTTI